MFKITGEKIIFDEKMQIEEATIEQSGDGKATKKFTRQRLNREDAAVVFIHNTEADTVVLIRQFRYAIAARVKAPILEIVAGKLDKGEEPLQAAIREAEEESGYRIEPGNIRLLASFFVSPGYTSEKFFLFHATVTNADKASNGGGLEAENEYLDVVEMDYAEFMKKAVAGELEDGKTLMAALFLNKPLS